VTRQEFERNFQLVLFQENARLEPKSSTNESSNSPRTRPEPSFNKIKVHVVRQELERKFEIVISWKSALR
jgi:hypothetical protein